jgi:hypothetical protein
MPTVIDSLILEFNLDTSQFTREQQRLMDQLRKMQEQAHNRAVDFEGTTKKMLSVFSNLQRAGLGAIAGMFGAGTAQQVVNMTDHFARLDMETERLSRTLGMSQRAVISWRTAFRDAGFTAEQGLGALVEVNKAMTAYGRGEVNQLSGFLGGLPGVQAAIYDEKGRMRTPDEALVGIAGVLDKMNLTDRERKSRLEASGLSESTQMFLMMNQRDLMAMLSAQKRIFGSDDSGKDAERSRLFIQAEGRLTTAFERLGAAITIELEPGLTRFANWLTAFLEKYNAQDPTGMSGLAQSLGAGAVNRWILSTPLGKAHPEWFTPAPEEAPAAGDGAGGGGTLGSNAEREAFIRKYAASIGLNPDMAAWIFQHEGGKGIGPRRQSAFPGEQSFGDFQLNYKPGSLGTLYTQETGRQAGDPRYWQEEDAWALRQMKKGGLSPWKAWHGPPNAGGAGSQNLSFNIQTMNVNGENSKEVASNLYSQLQRQKTAMLANSGAS